jgi:hypothetical protein
MLGTSANSFDMVKKLKNYKNLHSIKKGLPTADKRSSSTGLPKC